MSGMLPPFAIKRSVRARRVRLVIAPGKGLTVVLPRGLDEAVARAAVGERLDWVMTHLERCRVLEAAPPPAPPTCVALRALGREYALRYRHSAEARPGRVSLREQATVPQTGLPPAGRERPGDAQSGGVLTGHSLSISGDLRDTDAVLRALRAWLLRRAKVELPALLDAQARALGLSHAGVGVRMQRSRWGSCTAAGAISLNARLLFLPPRLAGYVLAHELAHTLHLNHSPDYWAALERLAPGARLLDRELLGARRYVPDWAR